MQRINLQLEQKEKLDEQLYRFRFGLPAGCDLQFEPGQFMSLAVKGFIRRSYSLSNPPHENSYVETYADTVAGGPGSQFWENVQEGDGVDALLPLGHFIYEPGESPVYFFATGTGIVPFVSMIRHELEQLKSGRQINLFFGTRTMKQAMAHDIFQKLASQHPNFRYTHFVSRPDGEHGSVEGRITDAIKDISETNISAYICGGRDMIMEVEELLVEKGVAKSDIMYERFY